MNSDNLERQSTMSRIKVELKDGGILYEIHGDGVPRASLELKVA